MSQIPYRSTVWHFRRGDMSPWSPLPYAPATPPRSFGPLFSVPHPPFLNTDRQHCQHISYMLSVTLEKTITLGTIHSASAVRYCPGSSVPIPYWAWDMSSLTNTITGVDTYHCCQNLLSSSAPQTGIRRHTYHPATGTKTSCWYSLWWLLITENQVKLQIPHTKLMYGQN